MSGRRRLGAAEHGAPRRGPLTNEAELSWLICEATHVVGHLIAALARASHGDGTVSGVKEVSW